MALRKQKELTAEEDHYIQAALGRLFKMGERAEQPGDAEEYEKIRHSVLTLLSD